jgi:uncharacterized short protein YbdD (DUF466 family)
MFSELGKFGAYLGQTARLMVGLPDYDNYLNHMQANHPAAGSSVWRQR